ncbi:MULTISPECIES: hypothetical protein [unclassified Nocardioides]|uniref:hypothetical protein n=1 Tax=unclassified Nocardioides TaxID=2615069 RepID=UPI0006F6D3AA|nr:MULTISPECIES: hypothetical protein [unclassified Nocardioides]KRA32744.1 hypothetical protein ASD81_14620 [Nocardioides sp. Root614]KRA89396.1 hypothetical protein ASD84_14885 [Nocardioides sp. Root682]
MLSKSVLSLAVLLLLSSGCGTEPSGADGGPAPLPDDTYQRVLSQGVDPALVHTIALSGFELAEQSAGVRGDSDYAAVYVPDEPPYTTEVHLDVKEGSYDRATCERTPLGGPSGGLPAPVESCEADGTGWYRTGGGWHEYVVSRDGHHLTVGAPTAAVDRDSLTRAALGARRQDGTTPAVLPPLSPVTRGDLPTTGDGAPVDPYGESPPGG